MKNPLGDESTPGTVGEILLLLDSKYTFENVVSTSFYEDDMRRILGWLKIQKEISSKELEEMNFGCRRLIKLNPPHQKHIFNPDDKHKLF